MATYNLTYYIPSPQSATPLRLASQWNFDETAIGVSQIAFIIPYILSSAFSGFLCDRYGTKIVALCAAFLLIPTTVCLGIPDHRVTYWAILIVFFVCGCLLASCQTAVYPEIAGVVHQRNDAGSKDGMAMCYGLYNIAYGVGMSIGPLIAGYIYGALGFFWLCIVLAGLYVVGLPLVFLFTGKSDQLIVRPSSIPCVPPSPSATIHAVTDEKQSAGSNV